MRCPASAGASCSWCWCASPRSRLQARAGGCCFPRQARPPLQTCVAPAVSARGGQRPPAAGASRRRPPRRGPADASRRVRAALAAASVIVDILRPGRDPVPVRGARPRSCCSRSRRTRRWRTSPRSGSRSAALALGRLLSGAAPRRATHPAMGARRSDRRSKWRVLGTVDAVYQNLAMIYAARSGLVASTLVHMPAGFSACWKSSIVFAFMGHPVSLGEAVVIESLLHAIRGAAFAIPGALGAQEGGLVLLCAAFGIPAGAGDCVVARQACRRSRARRARPLVLADAGMATPDAEHSYMRARQPREADRASPAGVQ